MQRLSTPGLLRSSYLWLRIGTEVQNHNRKIFDMSEQPLIHCLYSEICLGTCLKERSELSTQPTFLLPKSLSVPLRPFRQSMKH